MKRTIRTFLAVEIAASSALGSGTIQTLAAAGADVKWVDGQEPALHDEISR